MMSFTEFVALMREQIERDGSQPLSIQELEEDYRIACQEEAVKEQCQTIEGIMEYLS